MPSSTTTRKRGSNNSNPSTPVKKSKHSSSKTPVSDQDAENSHQRQSMLFKNPISAINETIQSPMASEFPPLRQKQLVDSNIHNLQHPALSNNSQASKGKGLDLSPSKRNVNFFDDDAQSNFDYVNLSPSKKFVDKYQEEKLTNRYPDYFYELAPYAQQVVLNKLTGATPIRPVSLDSQYNTVKSLLERTITLNEANSCLILGPRSTGKTLMVETALGELGTAYKNNFMVVRLSGFSLSDDRMAIREMCRQIDAQLASGNEALKQTADEIEKKSISESLSSLLTLLYTSPDELIPDEEEENEAYDEDIQGSVRILSKSKNVAMIVVIDGIDRFVLHNKQTLLYNLLDLVQSSKTPLAVVGITPKMNTREMFEKRVRSRFSQRVILTPRPQTIDDFWRIAKAGLILDKQELEMFHNENKQKGISITTNGDYHNVSYNNTKENNYTKSNDNQGYDYNKFINEWNSVIDAYYENKSSNLYKLVELIFYSSKDLNEFNSKLIYTVTLSQPVLDDQIIPLLELEQHIADTQSSIKCLSELELSLLVCAARVEIKYESDTFNFNVVYDEYVHMAKHLHKERMAAMSNPETGLAGGGYRIWSRDIARSCWERLQNLELVTYVDARANGTGTVLIPTNKSGSSGGGQEANDAKLTSVQTKPAVGSTKGAIISNDIRLAKVDASLLELSQLIGHDHVLKSWTRL